MRDAKVVVMADLRTETCCECGILFAMDLGFVNRRKEDHKTFYCPSGHGQRYTGENEAEKLRRQVDRMTQERARYEDEARRLRDNYAAAEKRAVLADKATKRLKARVHNGVCPDCNRSFTDLKRHMVSKHKPKCDAVQSSTAQ